MPVGCDFVCNNEGCKEYKNGIVITGPWELGEIDLIINSPVVKKKEEFRNKLIELKSQGRKYACINYPNFTEIPTNGYRINKWCRKCPSLWQYDIMLDEKHLTLEDAEKNTDIPANCPKCGEPLLKFADVIEEGVKCPSCQKLTKQNRWCSSASSSGIVNKKPKFDEIVASEKIERSKEK